MNLINLRFYGATYEMRDYGKTRVNKIRIRFESELVFYTITSSVIV